MANRGPSLISLCLARSYNCAGPEDWSRDGHYIAELAVAPSKPPDIWILPLTGDKKSYAYAESDFMESYPRVSPDSRWLAYVSNETKRDEVYVGTFPMPGRKWQVSVNGGGFPVWSRDGKELYPSMQSRGFSPRLGSPHVALAANPNAG